MKCILLWLFETNRSVTAKMNITFPRDFQEQVQKVERCGQSNDSWLPTSQLLSVLLATPAKYAGHKNEILMILQQLNTKEMKNSYKKEKIFNNKIYIDEIASYR